MSLPDDKFDAVLTDIAEHGNVSQALRDHELSRGNFYRRVANDAEFSDRYARAKSSGCHAIADSIRERMAKAPPKVATQFGEHVDAGWVQWMRNQVDADKWLLARLVPKVYGDKVTLAGDAENPIALVDQSAIAGKLLPELAPGGAPAPTGDPDET